MRFSYHVEFEFLYVPTFYIVVGTNTLPKHTPCSNGPNSAVKPSALDVIRNALQLLSGGFLFQCAEGDWYMVGGEKRKYKHLS
jgi:hypothetical protein